MLSECTNVHVSADLDSVSYIERENVVELADAIILFCMQLSYLHNPQHGCLRLSRLCSVLNSNMGHLQS